jgi:predicted DNA-binding transcriptional regulator YafY
VAWIEETSLRALAKLHQVLPSRLRYRVAAVESSTVPVPFRGPRVDPDVLTAVSLTCRDHERLRFDYRTHAGESTLRSVEPYRIVNDRRRWYLFAWDLDRADWRIFRVDRMSPRIPTGPRFAPRSLPPDADIAAHVDRGVREAHWRYRAKVVVHTPADQVRRRMPMPVRVEALADDRCRFEPGSDSPAMLALYLGFLDADFEVVDAPELVEALRGVAARYQRAVDASTTPAGG